MLISDHGHTAPFSGTDIDREHREPCEFRFFLPPSLGSSGSGRLGGRPSRFLVEKRLYGLHDDCHVRSEIGFILNAECRNRC